MTTLPRYFALPTGTATLNRYGEPRSAGRHRRQMVWFALTAVGKSRCASALPQRDAAADRADRHGHRRHGRGGWHRRHRRFHHAVRQLPGRHPGFRVVGKHRCRGVHRIFRRTGQCQLVAPVATGRRWPPPSAPAPPPNSGAMRISEEIDALEVMGIRSISFLASTRVMAGSRRHHPDLRAGDHHGFVSPQITTVSSTGSRTAPTTITSERSCGSTTWSGRSRRSSWLRWS